MAGVHHPSEQSVASGVSRLSLLVNHFDTSVSMFLSAALFNILIRQCFFSSHYSSLFAMTVIVRLIYSLSPALFLLSLTFNIKSFNDLAISHDFMNFCSQKCIFFFFLYFRREILNSRTLYFQF